MQILKNIHHAKNQRGFTLVETVVAIGIFVIVIGLTSSVFLNAFSSERRATVSRELYEETRIVLERIVKEIRKGSIDYEEYYNQRFLAGDYGENYGKYALQFWRSSANTSVPPDDILDLDRSDENVGENDGGQPFSVAVSQDELYLISADGGEKQIFKLIPDGSENQIALLRLEGQDCGQDHNCSSSNAMDSTEGDGLPDTWVPVDDFKNAGGVPEFLSIQSDSIQIKNLKFYLTPGEDPHKAFSDFSDDVQIQPRVTIVISTAPSELKMRGIKGDAPKVSLQTTVSTRAQSEILSLR